MTLGVIRLPARRLGRGRRQGTLNHNPIIGRWPSLPSGDPDRTCLAVGVLPVPVRFQARRRSR